MGSSDLWSNTLPIDHWGVPSKSVEEQVTGYEEDQDVIQNFEIYYGNGDPNGLEYEN